MAFASHICVFFVQHRLCFILFSPCKFLENTSCISRRFHDTRFYRNEQQFLLFTSYTFLQKQAIVHTVFIIHVSTETSNCSYCFHHTHFYRNKPLFIPFSSYTFLQKRAIVPTVFIIHVSTETSHNSYRFHQNVSTETSHSFFRLHHTRFYRNKQQFIPFSAE